MSFRFRMVEKMAKWRGEEGIVVVENVNGGDAVRDDDKEGNAGKEKDDEHVQRSSAQ